jgi:outer membrane protein assembly factor BamB
VREPDSFGRPRTTPGRDPILWRGPLLAGNRLILLSSTGQMAYVSPSDGRIQTTIETRSTFSLPPVIAGNMLYVLDDDGRLTAYR